MTKLSAMFRLNRANIFVGLIVCALWSGAVAATLEEGLAAQKRGDYETAVVLFRTLAEEGNVEAQYRIGWLYYNGLTGGSGSFLDEYISSTPDLAKRLGHDNVVEKNDAEALKWFRLAAEQGDARAQVLLGLMHESGRGVPQNLVEASKWYTKAAEKGNHAAQWALAQMYYDGRGVPKSYSAAASWFRKAADQEHTDAQAKLGLLYFHGRGVPQDYAEAAKWYQKAADQGDAGAQTTLGQMYINGWGVLQDYSEAARWIRKAAEQGNAVAQLLLGSMYGEGRGVPREYIAAYRWLNLAVSRLPAAENADEVAARDQALKARDWAAAHLTPAQIAKAQQWAREWKPNAAGLVPGDATPTAKRPSPAPTKATSARTPPVINVSPVLRTTTEVVEIAGKVGGGRVASLNADGSAAPFKPDGSFSFRRAVPPGDSEIRLEAIDEWGQTAQATVRVTRTLPDRSAAAFDPVQPGKLKAKPRPHAIALVIGVEKYENAPPAEFAENDARRFYDFAANALGVPRDRIRLLTGSEARRIDIDKAVLTWMKPLIAKGQTEVFVFFSGHGLAAEGGGDLYLLPYDGDRALIERSAVRRKELIDTIVEAGATSATLFLDTCYSGGTRGNETLVASARPILIASKEEQVPPNVTILAAAANDQLSSALAPAKHGLFSYFLMKGLEGEAAGSDRTITASELTSYLASRIPVEAAKLGRTQTPQVIGDENKIVATW